MQLKQASLLIVDDEPVLRATYAEWFKSWIAETLAAGNGLEALEVLAARKIDLIITDVRMPVMDGISLLKKIRERGLHRPGIVFTTGLADIEAREIYDLGADALLEKPVERNDLIQAAERSLVEREELWRTPLELNGCPKLTERFESLTAAVREHRIAFGRGGLCIETEQALAVGPLNLELNFRSDRFILSGQGVVRWMAQQENQMGIEFLYLAEESRDRVVQLTECCRSFIPRGTGTGVLKVAP
jgi:CheY-like chemotaxis protein